MDTLKSDLRENNRIPVKRNPFIYLYTGERMIDKKTTVSFHDF